MSDGQPERAAVRTRKGLQRRGLTCLLEKRDGSVEDFVVLVPLDPKPRDSSRSLHGQFYSAHLNAAFHHYR